MADENKATILKSADAYAELFNFVRAYDIAYKAGYLNKKPGEVMDDNRVAEIIQANYLECKYQEKPSINEIKAAIENCGVITGKSPEIGIDDLRAKPSVIAGEYNKFKEQKGLTAKAAKDNASTARKTYKENRKAFRKTRRARNRGFLGQAAVLLTSVLGIGGYAFGGLSAIGGFAALLTTASIGTTAIFGIGAVIIYKFAKGPISALWKRFGKTYRNAREILKGDESTKGSRKAMRKAKKLERQNISELNKINALSHAPQNAVTIAELEKLIKNGNANANQVVFNVPDANVARQSTVANTNTNTVNNANVNTFGSQPQQNPAMGGNGTTIVNDNNLGGANPSVDDASAFTNPANPGFSSVGGSGSPLPGDTSTRTNFGSTYVSSTPLGNYNFSGGPTQTNPLNLNMDDVDSLDNAPQIRNIEFWPAGFKPSDFVKLENAEKRKTIIKNQLFNFVEAKQFGKDEFMPADRKASYAEMDVYANEIVKILDNAYQTQQFPTTGEANWASSCANTFVLATGKYKQAELSGNDYNAWRQRIDSKNWAELSNRINQNLQAQNVIEQNWKALAEAQANMKKLAEDKAKYNSSITDDVIKKNLKKAVENSADIKTIIGNFIDANKEQLKLVETVTRGRGRNKTTEIKNVKDYKERVEKIAEQITNKLYTDLESVYLQTRPEDFSKDVKGIAVQDGKRVAPTSVDVKIDGMENAVPLSANVEEAKLVDEVNKQLVAEVARLDTLWGNIDATKENYKKLIESLTTSATGKAEKVKPEFITASVLDDAARDYVIADLKLTEAEKKDPKIMAIVEENVKAIANYYSSVRPEDMFANGSTDITLKDKDEKKEAKKLGADAITNQIKKIIQAKLDKVDKNWKEIADLQKLVSDKSGNVKGNRELELKALELVIKEKGYKVKVNGKDSSADFTTDDINTIYDKILKAKREDNPLTDIPEIGFNVVAVDNPRARNPREIVVDRSVIATAVGEKLAELKALADKKAAAQDAIYSPTVNVSGKDEKVTLANDLVEQAISDYLISLANSSKLVDKDGKELTELDILNQDFDSKLYNNLFASRSGENVKNLGDKLKDNKELSLSDTYEYTEGLIYIKTGSGRTAKVTLVEPADVVNGVNDILQKYMEDAKAKYAAKDAILKTAKVNGADKEVTFDDAVVKQALANYIKTNGLKGKTNELLEPALDTQLVYNDLFGDRSGKNLENFNNKKKLELSDLYQYASQYRGIVHDKDGKLVNAGKVVEDINGVLQSYVTEAYDKAEATNNFSKVSVMGRIAQVDFEEKAYKRQIEKTLKEVNFEGKDLSAEDAKKLNKLVDNFYKDITAKRTSLDGRAITLDDLFQNGNLSAFTSEDKVKSATEVVKGVNANLTTFKDNANKRQEALDKFKEGLGKYKPNNFMTNINPFNGQDKKLISETINEIINLQQGKESKLKVENVFVSPFNTADGFKNANFGDAFGNLDKFDNSVDSVKKLEAYKYIAQYLSGKAIDKKGVYQDFDYEQLVNGVNASNTAYAVGISSATIGSKAEAKRNIDAMEEKRTRKRDAINQIVNYRKVDGLKEPGFFEKMKNEFGYFRFRKLIKNNDITKSDLINAGLTEQQINEIQPGMM